MSLAIDRLWKQREKGIRHICFDQDSGRILCTDFSGEAWIVYSESDVWQIPTHSYRVAKTAHQIHAARLSPNGRFAAIASGAHLALLDAEQRTLIGEYRVGNVLGFIISRVQAIVLTNELLIASLDTGEIRSWDMNFDPVFKLADSDAPQRMASHRGSNVFWGVDVTRARAYDCRHGTELLSYRPEDKLYDVAVSGTRAAFRSQTGVSWIGFTEQDAADGSGLQVVLKDESQSGVVSVPQANPRIDIDDEGKRVLLVERKNLIVAHLEEGRYQSIPVGESLTFAAFKDPGKAACGTRKGEILHVDLP